MKKRVNIPSISAIVGKSTLVSRNVVVNGRRTSIRLEPGIWVALLDICCREGQTVHEICSSVAQHKKPETSLTASIRVLSVGYFRSAATEEGHCNAGHGKGNLL